MVTRRVRSLLAGLAIAGLLMGPAGVRAEEWGGIEPGLTTIDQVRARYGAPSKEAREGGRSRYHPVGLRGRARPGRRPDPDGGLRPAHAPGLQADGGARVPDR